MKLDKNNTKDLIIHIAETFEKERDFLCKLDSFIGDGDHGSNMERGFKAVKQAVSDRDLTIEGLFKLTGRTLISKIGGAIGPIFGTIFIEFSKTVKDSEAIDKDIFVDMLTNALDGVKQLGKVHEGEKTLVDALSPAQAAANLANSKGLDLGQIVKEAVRAAEEGVENTKGMVATKGRAKFLKERSKGYQDAGATSLYLMLYSIDEFIAEREDNNGSD